MSTAFKDTSVTAGDSNPHSAGQKHQSFNFGALNRSATTLPKLGYKFITFTALEFHGGHGGCPSLGIGALSKDSQRFNDFPIEVPFSK